MTPVVLLAQRFIFGRNLIVPIMLQLACATCLDATGAGIKWYSEMSLGDVQQPTVDKWRTSLSERWLLGGDPVILSTVRGGKPLVIDRCTRLFAAVESGLTAWGADQAIFDGWMVKCDAVRSLIGATAPKQDFLGDFTLDERGIKALPVGVAFQISRDDERKVASIKSTGGSLGDYLGSVTLKALGKPEDRRMIVHDDSGASQLLSVLAEGDFDHDGINDLLISSNNSMTGGSYHAAHLYIVSRLSAGGPLVLRKQLR